MTTASGLYDWLLLRDAEAVASFVASLSAIGPRVLAPATIAVVGLGVGWC